MSIAGGIPLAVERARKTGCTVLQIFVKNRNRWKGRSLSEEEAAAFRLEREAAGLFAVVAHDSYLINLAAPGEELWSRSIEALVDELERSQRLRLSHLVAHPGAHMGEGESRGIRRIARALDVIHERTSDFRIRLALETTAGQGTSIGYRFEHLRDVLSACRDPARVDVCLDTCHVFAAGYDFRSEEGYHRTLEDFDKQIGLSRLRVIHLNDSKRELGSRVDRHEHIGRGQIGKAGFHWFLNDERFRHVPKILETPKGEDLREDRRNLRVLRSLIRSGKKEGSASRLSGPASGLAPERG